MRIQFTTEKRPANLARRLHKILADMQLPKSKSACREAIAIASGYRNWNELLKIIGANIPMSHRDSDDGVGSFQEIEFSLRLCAALSITTEASVLAVSSLRPFEGPSLTEITDDHIHLMASNLCALGYPIEDLSTGDYKGFGLVYDPVSERGKRCIYVSRDGRDLRNCAPGEQWSAYFGDSDLSDLLNAAGLSKLPQNPNVIPVSSPAHSAVYETLRRLDRKVLLFLKMAGEFNRHNYMHALDISKDSPLFSLSTRFPALASQFCQYSKFKDLHDDPNLEQSHFGVVFAADPIEAFSDYVGSRQKELWPDNAVSKDRVRTVVEHYLSVKVDDLYVVYSDVPAFMCHIPDELFPRTGKEMGELATFYDKHRNIFANDGLCVSPNSFSSEFNQRTNGDWAKLNDISNISYRAVHNSIGTTLLSVAAYAAGYPLSQGQFEESETEEIARLIGNKLASEAKLGLYSVIDMEKRLEFKQTLDEMSAMTDEDYSRKAQEDFATYKEFGIISLQHKDKSAVELISILGYDIHEIVASLTREKPGLPGAKSGGLTPH